MFVGDILGVGGSDTWPKPSEFSGSGTVNTSGGGLQLREGSGS